MPAAPAAVASPSLPEGDFLPLVLQLAAVVADVSEDVVCGSPLFARVPRSDRAHLVLRGLLCASASLPVNLGLSVEEVAAEVEAFARRLRSGEAEATGAAVVAQLAAEEPDPFDPWKDEEDDSDDDGDDQDDGQPDSRQEHRDFAGDDEPSGYGGYGGDDGF